MWATQLMRDSVASPLPQTSGDQSGDQAGGEEKGDIVVSGGRCGSITDWAA